MKFSEFKKIIFFILLLILPAVTLVAQTPESATALSQVGRLWGGYTAVGGNGNFSRPSISNFFPNDYDIVYYNGQANDNYFGGGFRLGATNWTSPTDSFYNNAVFGAVSEEYDPDGTVTVPLTNYLRHRYTSYSINNVDARITDFGSYNPEAMTDGTYDQVLSSTYKNVLGVEVKRRVLAWSQNYNDNYVIIEVELTNVGVDNRVPDTLHNFFFQMQMGTARNFYSNTNLSSSVIRAIPKYQYTWQHYYGARPGDSLRVFYSYSADDPKVAGDDMGAPINAQSGRLAFTHILFNTILHASKEPYTDEANDVDDPLQPRVTYIGTETMIPDLSSGSTESKNYWALRGGFSDTKLMPGSYEGTHHYINNDELGVSNFSSFTGGTTSSTNSKNFSGFGPYTLAPGQKIKIVYAAGVAGIGQQLSQEVGRKWANGTLENPPSMPDPNTGWLPSNFAFPSDATEMDKRKDRWVSMGIDSVMLSAYRAKWNFEHNYQIPAAPAPPEKVQITGYGDTGIEIIWNGSQAESHPNFAGYSIFRKKTAQDTVFYEEVYSSGPEDKAVEHRFNDTTVIKTVPYYYYVQSKALIDPNDQNADPTTRGKMMYSGRNFVPNVTSVSPPNVSSEDMSQIRIVPNPYNINDPLIKTQFVDVDYRRINFMSLPAVVTIKIYTENGDLVRTLYHDKSSLRDGLEPWDMMSDNQQVISSGVYIAVFQKPNGETSYQKFIVVR